jgi:hypothetical protein
MHWGSQETGRALPDGFIARSGQFNIGLDQIEVRRQWHERPRVTVAHGPIHLADDHVDRLQTLALVGLLVRHGDAHLETLDRPPVDHVKLCLTVASGVVPITGVQADLSDAVVAGQPERQRGQAPLTRRLTVLSPDRRPNADDRPEDATRADGPRRRLAACVTQVIGVKLPDPRCAT